MKISEKNAKTIRAHASIKLAQSKAFETNLRDALKALAKAGQSIPKDFSDENRTILNVELMGHALDLLALLEGITAANAVVESELSPAK